MNDASTKVPSVELICAPIGEWSEWRKGKGKDRDWKKSQKKIRREMRQRKAR